MATFSALLAMCAGNSPITREFTAQRRSFDVFFDLRLSKQSWGWWFGTASRPLWRHSNGEEISVKFESKYNNFHRIKWICKRCEMSTILSRSQCVNEIHRIFCKSKSTHICSKGFNGPSSVRMMAWCQTGDKPLLVLMVTQSKDVSTPRLGVFVDSLAPGRCGSHFKTIVFKLILRNNSQGTCCKIVLVLMPQLFMNGCWLAAVLSSNVDVSLVTLIPMFMGPTWGPSGADRTQVGPMLASWTLLSEEVRNFTNERSTLDDCISDTKPESKVKQWSNLTILHGTKLIWHVTTKVCNIWWRHQMETFSALLALCVGNSLVTGAFPAQGQWRRALNKRLSKQSWGWRFETPSSSLWRHRNDIDILIHINRQIQTGKWRGIYIDHSMMWKIFSGLNTSLKPEHKWPTSFRRCFQVHFTKIILFLIYLVIYFLKFHWAFLLRVQLSELWLVAMVCSQTGDSPIPELMIT